MVSMQKSVDVSPIAYRISVTEQFIIFSFEYPDRAFEMFPCFQLKVTKASRREHVSRDCTQAC